VAVGLENHIKSLRYLLVKANLENCGKLTYYFIGDEVNQQKSSRIGGKFINKIMIKGMKLPTVIDTSLV